MVDFICVVTDIAMVSIRVYWLYLLIVLLSDGLFALNKRVSFGLSVDLSGVVRLSSSESILGVVDTIAFVVSKNKGALIKIAFCILAESLMAIIVGF